MVQHNEKRLILADEFQRSSTSSTWKSGDKFVESSFIDVFMDG